MALSQSISGQARFPKVLTQDNVFGLTDFLVLYVYFPFVSSTLYFYDQCWKVATAMILSQISYLDCIVFLIFLAPQLLIGVNTFELLICIVQALPVIGKAALGFTRFTSTLS